MSPWASETFEKAILKFRRSAALAAEMDIIPYKNENGVWAAGPFDGDGWWTNGFWPALMWQLYAAEKDEAFATEARRVQKRLADELRVFHRLNHDVGFMYLLSVGADYKLTGDMQAMNDTQHAAGLLAGRFNPLGFLRAWGGVGREGWAIIDCMMNLPLLYWAQKELNDPRFGAIGKIHADMAIRHFVRENGSCEHIVIFDPVTGEVVDKPAGQGYAKGSSWSRGQAWGLYGFTLNYMATGEKRYLQTAQRIAAYFESKIREDGLTDCDFAQPDGEERIDNMAGAIAACGYLELHRITGDAKYEQTAMRLLTALDTLCTDWTDKSVGILTKCTASYNEDGAGRHTNILYGDYFFVEALAKLNGTDPMLWMHKDQ